MRRPTISTLVMGAALLAGLADPHVDGTRVDAPAPPPREPPPRKPGCRAAACRTLADCLCNCIACTVECRARK